MAENHGLKIEYIKTYGWTITLPTPELIECVQENGWKNFKTFEVSKDKPQSSSSTRKYICTDCTATCRATRDISLICGQCNKPMIKV